MASFRELIKRVGRKIGLIDALKTNSFQGKIKQTSYTQSHNIYRPSKVVGVGLNKTGTKTLGACMVHLQFKHVTFSPEAFDLWRNNDYPALMKWVSTYDSFEDWPWPLMYKEIDKWHPGSSFILTRRKNPDIWFKSLCRHAERSGPTIFRKVIYGYEMPHDHKHEHIAYYEKHLDSVREYFKDRPNDLLEVCWEEGDGWAELAQFLHLPQPDIPFPHENKTPDQAS